MSIRPVKKIIQSKPTMEGAGPEHIEVQQFGGFGPMGVNALGDW